MLHSTHRMFHVHSNFWLFVIQISIEIGLKFHSTNDVANMHAPIHAMQSKLLLPVHAVFSLESPFIALE